MRLFACIIVLLAVSAPPAQARVVTGDVRYTADGREYFGYFAYENAAPMPQPGVVVIDGWWGLTEHGLRRAREIAALGYGVLAIDMYGGRRVAKTPEQANSITRRLYGDRARLRRVARAGLEALMRQPYVDNGRLAAVGYGFGGTVALELARAAPELKAAVSVYGGLRTPDPAAPGAVKAHVLVLAGASDPTVTRVDRDAITREMAAAAPSFRLIDYPGVTHGFADPASDALGRQHGLPMSYSAAAAAVSATDIATFLGNVLGR